MLISLRYNLYTSIAAGDDKYNANNPAQLIKKLDIVNAKSQAFLLLKFGYNGSSLYITYKASKLYKTKFNNPATQTPNIKKYNI